MSLKTLFTPSRLDSICTILIKFNLNRLKCRWKRAVQNLQFSANKIGTCHRARQQIEFKTIHIFHTPIPRRTLASIHESRYIPTDSKKTLKCLQTKFKATLPVSTQMKSRHNMQLLLILKQYFQKFLGRTVSCLTVQEKIVKCTNKTMKIAVSSSL